MSMLRGKWSTHRASRDGTFVPLLAALLIVMVGAPFAIANPVASMLLVSVVLIAGVFAVHNGIVLRGGMVLVLLLVLGLRWAAHVHGEGEPWLVVGARVAVGAYMAMLAALSVVVVLRRGRVTRDAVLGAVCGYLLIAYMFASWYAALEGAFPGSFVSSLVLMDREVGRIGGSTAEFFYYSFSVLTTVGFGDIVPANIAARSLSTLEMVAGQLYLAAFVARLVGALGMHDVRGNVPVVSSNESHS